MTPQDKARCNSLLVTLAFNGGNSVVRQLRDELESVHGIAVTLDRVRTDVRWLADLGAVLRNDDLLQITQDGRDHVNRLRELF